MVDVVLVDSDDNPLGMAEKMLAHQAGLLHRAFSVVLLRENEGHTECLLQQRAMVKYHSQGLWSNACCSHPGADEDIVDAAKQRMHEELNFSCSLKPVGSFIYQAELDTGLIEHELDHVLVGHFDDDVPAPNSEEVMAVRWIGVDDLRKALQCEPEQYTPWLLHVLEIALGAGN